MAVVVVASAARLPGADDVATLWENLLEGRRHFRRVPPQRLDLSLYGADAGALAITPIMAGLLTDWTFDRRWHRVPSRAYHGTDLTHWLALETAMRVWRSVGAAGKIDRTRVAVILGNTLTGEFSRAQAVGLRAPSLDRMLDDASAAVGLTAASADALREAFRERLARRLHEPDEEMLAGALANTIAGRVANHLNLKGGAFTVDGACASSLLAVVQGAEAIEADRVDCVLAGGVDLSLDPFELVGFSRVGALSPTHMRVFDARSDGFWPGEGAGVLMLMREDLATDMGVPVLARLRGWGLSTDGEGGLTRPTVEGQKLVIGRACEMAGISPNDLDVVEAHGTGTPTGDPVEVRAIAELRDARARPLGIGSIKANIGHTKAAAGVAGLIKAIEMVRHGVAAPHAGCQTPHSVFAETGDRVRPLVRGELLSADRAPIAGVSSFGFGGINAHIVLEAPSQSPVRSLPRAPAPTQDAELFCLAADDWSDLEAELRRVVGRTETLALCELAEAAASLWARSPRGQCRAAVVATDAKTLEQGMRRALGAAATRAELFDPRAGVFVARAGAAPRIGLLFPGQGGRALAHEGAVARRFGVSSPAAPDPHGDTRSVQPWVAECSLAGLTLLESCGVEASVAAGHSLGELTALAWGGAIARDDLIDLARCRGAAFAEHADAGGGMLRVAAAESEVEALVRVHDLEIACDNGPSECVVGGAASALAAFATAASARRIETTQLPVSHAFHTRMIQPAQEPWRAALGDRAGGPVSRLVVSSVLGRQIQPGDDVNDLLVSQLVAPVRFTEVLSHLGAATDLLVECGAGAALSRMAGDSGLRAVSVDVVGPSIAPLLGALGAVFTAGGSPVLDRLYSDRRLRPFDWARTPSLLANPLGRERPPSGQDAASDPEAAVPLARALPSGEGELLSMVRAIVADEIDQPIEMVGPDDPFDTALRIQSLGVARIVNRAARAAGCSAPRAPTEFARSTARELADALADMKLARGPGLRAEVEGLAPWIRSYRVDWRPATDLAESRSSTDAPTVDPHHLLDLRGAEPEGAPECLQALRDNTAAGASLTILADDEVVFGLGRSLVLEGVASGVRVLIDPPSDEVDAAVARPPVGFSARRWDCDGQPLEPVFAPFTPPTAASPPIGPQDTVLVTGGGRGIAAECALRLAATTGCGLILCGRSSRMDKSVRATLRRARNLRLRATYAQADVADSAGLVQVVGRAARRVGRPTVLLHAAGLNTPAPLKMLSDAQISDVMAPKTDGLRHAIQACGDGLRRLYAFGSIIGAVGLAGEAHYALANAWQTKLMARHAAAHPECLTLSIEWSVWGEAGMGERLGILEALAARDVRPMGVEEACAEYLALVAQNREGAVVVTGRFGDTRDLPVDPLPLQQMRFVGETKVAYPGVERVSETRLWAGRDPYLLDHRLDGEAIFPGVMALEACAQSAAALSGQTGVSRMENVRFSSRVAVATGGHEDMRLCALVRTEGVVDVALRAGDDGFGADRMAAVVHVGGPAREAVPGRAPAVAAVSPLYAGTFFQSGRFRRLAEYERITARWMRAVLRPDPGAPFFGPLDAQRLLLGDAGARDAALHALQAMVPHRRVLPAGVGLIEFLGGQPPCTVEAEEISASDGHYTFNLALRDAEGAIVERWTGAHFQAVSYSDPAPALRVMPALLPVYVERLGREVLGLEDLRCSVGGGAGTRAARRARAVAEIGVTEVGHTSDGRPLVKDGHLSLSHGGPALALASRRRVACDVQALPEVPSALPPPSALGTDLAWPEAWVAGEALRKLGRVGPQRLWPSERRVSANEAGADLLIGRDARVLVTRAPWAGKEVAIAIATESVDE